MTKQDFALYPVDNEALPPLLREPDMEGGGYRVVTYGEDGLEHSSTQGFVLWDGNSRRGGVSFGADPVWTDADSAYDAVRRVLEADIVP